MRGTRSRQFWWRPTQMRSSGSGLWRMGSSAISANQWTTTISNDASVRRCDPVRLQSRTH